MNTPTIVFFVFAALIIIISLIWRLRIKQNKIEDDDFDRNDSAKENPDLERNTNN